MRTTRINRDNMVDNVNMACIRSELERGDMTLSEASRLLDEAMHVIARLQASRRLAGDFAKRAAAAAGQLVIEY